MGKILVQFLALLSLSAIVTLGGSPARAADCDAPKPDFRIAAPAASVGAAAAAFSGVWAGNWTFTVRVGSSRGNAVECNIVHISVKDDQSAKVVDCVGSLTELNQGPRCDAFDAKINNGELSFTAVNGSVRSFRLAGPGTLAAQSINRQNKTNTTELHRQ